MNSYSHQQLLDNLTFHRFNHGNVESDNMYAIGMNELFDKGYALHNTRSMYSNYTSSILCKLDNQFISGIFYTDDPVILHNMVAITLTYVLPEYRGNNLFTLLHKQVDVVLRERNLSGCLSWQSVRNEEIARIRENVGYKEVMILYKRGLLNQ